MLHAVAVWNYAYEGADAIDVIDALLDVGFDAISHSTHPLSRLDQGEVERIAGHLVGRDVPVTLHSSPFIDSADLERVIAPFMPVLRCVTFDPARDAHPLGSLYAAAHLARRVREVLDLTVGTQVRVGVEDFPINADAMAAFADDLAPITGDPRWGILIDIGHMHIRLSGEGYFAGMTVGEHLAQVPLEIIELHVHDNDGQADQHAPIGVGTVNFAQVAAAVCDAGFDGISTSEIVPRGQGVGSLKEAMPLARRSLECWRQVLERATVG